MGELEGTYRILQSPGSRLGAQKNTGVSTLEPEQKSSAMTTSKQKNKGLQLKVLMLDDTEELFDVESKSYGEALLIQVLKHSNLIESDYFGLEFLSNQSNWIWLEPTKLLMKQIQRPKNTVIRLSVKFFPPDPGQLLEEYTRYLFALQIKRDLTECRLTCSENTATLIVSHLLQSEIGDFDETLDQEQLKMHKYLPNQEAVQEKILQFHKKHFGQTPAESDFQVLEIARKLDMYGIRFHPAFDREGTKINLAVANMGVLVFQGTTKINTFSWAKIRKLSFKRKRFLIKLYPEPQGTYQDTLEFLMSSRDQCKILWKSCVEYHTFFRTYDQPKPKAKPVLFSRGSSFRYSGRTQKQLSEYIRSTDVRKSSYQRRYSKSRVSSRSLNTDVPKQSFSFTESIEVPGSPSSASVSFPTVHTTSPAISSLPVFGEAPFLDSRQSPSRSFVPGTIFPTSPDEMGKRRKTDPADSPSLQSLQGLGSNQSASSFNPGSLHAESSSCVELVVEDRCRDGEVKNGNDNDEDDCTMGVFLTDHRYDVSKLRGRGEPIFTSTNSHLQVTEEFIDDDPAEMSFFAGGMEAFSYAYSGGNGKSLNALSKSDDVPHLANKNAARHNQSSTHSSPSKYYTDMVNIHFEHYFEHGESDFNGNEQPTDASDLFEVKAQAIKMQGLLSQSETSSLINNQSESSSLNNLMLNGTSETTSLNLANSATHSEASSMVNFPPYSVRSDSSSAFQFSDIIDQLEQMNYPPATTTEDSSSSDSDTWDSENGSPLDGNLFFSNPFAQTAGGLFSYDFHKNVKSSSSPGSQKSGIDL